MIGEILADTNLQGLWHLNGSSNDTSVNANNGTDSNITYTTGKFNQSAYFNGTSSKITLGTGPDLTSDFTIMWWANADQIGSDVGTITKRNAFASLDFQIFEESSSSGNIEITVGATNIFSNSSGVKYTVGQWVHVAITRSGNVWTIYRNATPFKTVTSATAMPTGDTLRFGVLGNDAASYFKGYLDEIVMLNRAMSFKEISDYYSWSTGRFTKIL